MRMSIAIPTYEMRDGSGYKLLEYSLNIIKNQSFKDFEVVVTDHSIDNRIKDLCEQWSKIIDIKYYRVTEKRGSPSFNTNHSIKMSRGEIIKLLCQDDYLYDNTSLEKISNAFGENTRWLVSSYYHSQDKNLNYKYHIPKMNNRIYVVNTIGTPSCLTIRNKDVIYIDENLSWAYDCEYYKRLYDKFGSPTILNEPTMVNYLWEGQTTNTMASEKLRNKENQYILNKYENAQIK